MSLGCWLGCCGVEKPRRGTAGVTLTWEHVWYRPAPTGFTERSDGKVYGLYFHYKAIITTLQTFAASGGREGNHPKFSHSVQLFSFCVFTSRPGLSTHDFSWLLWFHVSSSLTCPPARPATQFTLDTQASPALFLLSSQFSYLMTTEKFLKKVFHDVTN